MITRVYALFMKSRRVLLFLVSVALAAIGVGCVGVMPAVISVDDDHDFMPLLITADMVSGPFYLHRLRQLD